jgi:hypothetical protein
MPLSEFASDSRAWFCCSFGNMSTMRLTVSRASVVCSVEMTRWPGLGGLQRGGDGLEVAHLPDEDDVGVLPGHGLQPGGEVVGVDADLALVDDRVVVAVHHLDGVLEGDDVAAPVALMWLIIAAVVVVLPDPVGPVTSTSPRCSSASLRTAGGRPSEAKSCAARQHPPGDDADRAALPEDVDAEPADPGDRVGEVGLVVLLELGARTRSSIISCECARCRPGTAAAAG